MLLLVNNTPAPASLRWDCFHSFYQFKIKRASLLVKLNQKKQTKNSLYNSLDFVWVEDKRRQENTKCRLSCDRNFPSRKMLFPLPPTVFKYEYTVSKQEARFPVLSNKQVSQEWTKAVATCSSVW